MPNRVSFQDDQTTRARRNDRSRDQVGPQVQQQQVQVQQQQQQQPQQQGYADHTSRFKPYERQQNYTPYQQRGVMKQQDQRQFQQQENHDCWNGTGTYVQSYRVGQSNRPQTLISCLSFDGAFTPF